MRSMLNFQQLKDQDPICPIQWPENKTTIIFQIIMLTKFKMLKLIKK